MEYAFENLKKEGVSLDDAFQAAPTTSNYVI